MATAKSRVYVNGCKYRYFVAIKENVAEAIRRLCPERDVRCVKRDKRQ